MTTTYHPATEGGWLGLAHGHVALMVDAAPLDGGIGRGPSADELWRVLTESDPLPPLLDRLTERGLSSTPPFAVLEWSTDPSRSDQLRVIVRGGVRVTVTDDAGEHLLSGTGVSTWAERTFTGMLSAVVAVQGATAAPLSLPIVSGMTLAAGLSVSRSSRAVTPVAPVPGADAGREDVTAPAVTPVPAPGPAPEPAPEPVDDSISEQTVVAPARTRTGGAPKVVSPSEPPPVDGAPSEQTVASIGDTVVRSVAEDTALPGAQGSGSQGSGSDGSGSAGAEASSSPLGDHDGQTVMTSDISALRGSRAAEVAPPIAPATAAASVRLLLPDGDTQPLDRPVLIGRSPSVSQVSGGSMPRLVMLGTGDQDISRNHARVALEGGTVVVTDLHSRNGTIVVLPGKPPRKLRAGEPTAVIVGTVIDLGGGITITVDAA